MHPLQLGRRIPNGDLMEVLLERAHLSEEDDETVPRIDVLQEELLRVTLRGDEGRHPASPHPVDKGLERGRRAGTSGLRVEQHRNLQLEVAQDDDAGQFSLLLHLLKAQVPRLNTTDNANRNIFAGILSIQHERSIPEHSFHSVVLGRFAREKSNQREVFLAAPGLNLFQRGAQSVKQLRVPPHLEPSQHFRGCPLALVLLGHFGVAGKKLEGRKRLDALALRNLLFRDGIDLGDGNADILGQLGEFVPLRS
mmetsp:Transcript_192/g.796  ORF Transcript_192/g.796 Transcript_192/m.796 type:complete len:252 (-) Transcript_192:244-999(-)